MIRSPSSTEAWRADREVVYGDMYAQCERTLRGTLPAHTLAERLAPRTLAADEALVPALQAAIERHFGPGKAGAQQHFRAEWLAALLQSFTQRGPPASS